MRKLKILIVDDKPTMRRILVNSVIKAGHSDVTEAVDAVLRGQVPEAETRWIDESGEVARAEVTTKRQEPPVRDGRQPPRLYLFGVNRDHLEDAARERGVPLEIVPDLREANVLLTTRAFFRRRPQKVKDAEAAGTPIYVLKNNNTPQMRQCLGALYPASKAFGVDRALQEAEEAIDRVKKGEGRVELSPQASYVRKLQHALADKHGLSSRSMGRDPDRRVSLSSPSP